MYAPRYPAVRLVPSNEIEETHGNEAPFAIVDEAGVALAQVHDERAGAALARAASEGDRFEKALERILSAIGSLDSMSSVVALHAGIGTVRSIAEVALKAQERVRPQTLRMTMSAAFRGERVELVLFPRGRAVDWDFEDPSDKPQAGEQPLSDDEIGELQDQATQHMKDFANFLKAEGIRKNEGHLHYGAFMAKTAQRLNDEQHRPGM